MAGIDKTYTDSYVDYKEFKDWADKQILTFYDGYKLCIGDWVRDCEKEDFDDGEIPIMNTSTLIDIYLIQNCKSDFVLDRMKSVYDKDSYNKFQSVDLTTKPPIEFQQNRKIVIKRNNRTKFPIHSSPYNSSRGKNRWWIQCDDRNFSYYDETDTWTSRGNYYPSNTNTSHRTSIEAVVRHLRKQYLPKGISFTMSGRFVGEEYTIHIR